MQSYGIKHSGDRNTQYIFYFCLSLLISPIDTGKHKSNSIRTRCVVTVHPPVLDNIYLFSHLFKLTNTASVGSDMINYTFTI